MRLDKFLVEQGIGSRKEVKLLIKQKRVRVNQCIDVEDKLKIEEEIDEVFVDDKKIEYRSKIFIMLNKPSGVVTATQDHQYQTVMDCISSPRKDLFPVGRLDIDTEGLLLICNDGKLAHELLSPKYHVDKVYKVKLKYEFTNFQQRQLMEGIQFKDFKTKPAKVKVCDPYTIELTIHEGKFHQVKRMLLAVGNEVSFLKRIAFKNLKLDETLSPGSWRYLHENEICDLYKK